MTKLKPLLALIFFTLIASIISTPSIIIHQNRATDLIEETCKQTPNHDLCVHYLRSDPRSLDSDVTGLALIMVNIIKEKANNALDKIHQLIQRTPEEAGELKQALNTCADRFRAIVEADVPKAIAALKKGDPKFAEDGANDAVIEATSCEKSFNGKSPITHYNNDISDAAIVTAAIVRLML